MKKIIALILAVMMLGSVSVFATNSLTVGAQPSNAPAFKVEADGKTASQHTDLWLQVEAAGQIDVTVPLLLVFKTNIDGGTAEAPTNYVIENKSSAPLAVKQIVTTVYNGTNAADPKMELVEHGTAYGEDQYGVKLSFVGTENDGVNNGKTVDLWTNTPATSGTTMTYTKTEANEGEGLFVLEKATASGTSYTASETKVLVNMGTGKLSFVTKHKDDGALDTNQGVKLLSIAYTVAIQHDEASAKGDYIKDTVGTTGTIYGVDKDGKVTITESAPYTYDYTPTP